MVEAPEMRGRAASQVARVRRGLDAIPRSATMNEGFQLLPQYHGI